MKYQHLFLTLNGAVILIGCAAAPDMNIPADHPANPDAAVAAMPAASTILEQAAAPSPQTQPAAMPAMDHKTMHHHEGGHP